MLIGFESVSGWRVYPAGLPRNVIGFVSPAAAGGPWYRSAEFA